MQDRIAGAERAVDSADACADMARRNLLKAGATGAAVAGVVAAGGPSVLGLGTAPAYAAGASQPGPTTVAPPSPGSVAVRITLMDGGSTPTVPVNIPQSGTAPAYLYASPDRTTAPVASVPVRLQSGQSVVEYTFADVAPGDYYVDIQEPFDSYGAAGVRFLLWTYYVDWNFGHRPRPNWYPEVAEYQPVTVTAGGTAAVNVEIQVALKTTRPPWSS